nr:MAG TPA: hypothetical protein [Caudoviricetes sp.]
MGKFNEYSQKATPADNDTLMIYDATSKANKLSPFSGIWNWIVGKLTNAVISNLETQNKSVVGALNELNSKAIVTKINTSSDRFKTDFETWFSAQKDRSMHIIFLNAGWQSMVIGYKANSKYGKFIQINYSTSSNAFCTVLEGKITWGV